MQSRQSSENLPPELESAATWAQKQDATSKTILKNNLQKFEKVFKPYICTKCTKNIHQKEVKTFKHCGQCKEVYYCSVDCQKKDWSKHQQNCRKN